jgi:signal peptidase I
VKSKKGPKKNKVSKNSTKNSTKNSSENSSEKTFTIGKNQFEQLKLRMAARGSIEIVLVSGSMAPLIKTGDRAVIAPAKLDELVERDMIVFAAKDILICHCVWGHSVFPSADGERMVITRGLAGQTFDYPVRESEILGKVISHTLGPMRFIWYMVYWKTIRFLGRFLGRYFLRFFGIETRSLKASRIRGGS